MGDKSRRISISGPAALHAGQLLRRAVDAVLVGPGTVLTDEPTLDWRPGGQKGAGPGQSRNLISPNLDGSEKERSDSIGDFDSEANPRSNPRPNSDSNSSIAFDSNASGSAGPESRKESQKVAGSSPNSPSHYLQSADPFIEALLRYGDEAEMQNPYFDHQPRRIFLLPEGQMEKSQLDAFQAKQWQRFEQGGPEPVFWTLSKKHHPGDLPALKDPFFGSALMQNLAELGLNTVLIEGGAGLHRSLETILQPDDRFYWLRRKENLISVDFEKPVKLPHFLTELPQLQSMDLGPDELVAFAGRA